MTSKDDDTLPLPGFSEELSVDATVDEDFIPTSQPQCSSENPKTQNSEGSFIKSPEELKCSVSDSRIDDTLPPEAVMNQSALDKDRSTDFIPDTETKKTQITYCNPEPSCRKKLPVFGVEDCVAFKLQSNPLWESETSKVPESPALETQNISILNDTPTNILPSEEAADKCEESITEIIVNDSAETVDLDATPLKIKAPDSERLLDKLEISQTSSSYAGRCEETQIFDNSSVLLLDQPGAGSDLEKSERISGVTSEKLYLQETVDDEGTKLERKVNGFGSASSPHFAVAEASGKADITGKTEEICAENVFPKQEVRVNSGSLESNSSSIVTRKIDFKLTVSCFVTVNTKTNKVLQKIILNVNETPKPKPKPAYLEPVSDNTSDKSKRYSTSSSGSVYSDKMGPFALPKRVSAISDQTDSSEEEFGSLLTKERRALERVPWSNEYLLPLKMDDIMLVSIENQELLKRPNIVSSPRKVKNKRCNEVSHLKEILESSTSEQTSHCNLGSGELESSRTSPRENSEEGLAKRTPESSEPLLPEEEKNLEEDPKERVETEANTKAAGPQCPNKEEPTAAAAAQDGSEAENEQPGESKNVEEETKAEEGSSVRFTEGLPVLARWTDKRYYSGTLCGTLRNERWEVKFDDGTRKTVREDFVMPAEWLTVGALVFAMNDDKYESGQIVDVRKGEEVSYVVELDTEKKKICVKVSDLCLTDVMAGIVREKYKPVTATPRAKADIDFDNVLTGKRLREQRTPLRPPATVQTGSSGPKKKSSSKPRKEDHLESLKETPANDDAAKKMRGLKSENGHLVEDKIISTDSPSGTEAVETPLRRSAKDSRKKAKPRSLSYEAEDARSWKEKSKNWLAPDGTPIPGPSGVKFKKQKTKPRAEEAADEEAEPAPKSSKKSPTRCKTMPSNEKSKRKRKLDESVEDNVHKKSLKEEESRMKTRSRKG